jgi:hypothetical protein
MLPRGTVVVWSQTVSTVSMPMPRDCTAPYRRGYVTVNETNGRNLYYMFAESSEVPPSEAPLIVRTVVVLAVP